MTAKDIEVLRDLEKFIYPEKGSIAIKFKQALSRASPSPRRFRV